MRSSSWPAVIGSLVISGLLFSGGCGKRDEPKPREDASQAVPKGDGAKRAAPLAQIEFLSVRSKTFTMAGKAATTFVLTLKATPTPGAEVPQSAADMWAFIAYVSGPSTEGEVAELLRALSVEDRPKGSTFNVSNTGTPIDDKKFRHAIFPAELKPIAGEGKAQKRGTFCYAAILAPEEAAGRWNLSSAPEISIPVTAWRIDYTSDTPTLRVAEEQSGVVAVRLWGFPPEGNGKGTPLSEPISVPLKAGEPK